MLTILYYHEVVKKGEGNSYQKIDIDKFYEQMKYLADNGYVSLFFSELEKGEIPKKAVIVSFDDGFRSVYDKAYPIMKEFGIKGNVYLPTAFIGQKPQFMDWEMVKEMGDSFEIQAHTHSHVDVRGLDKEELQSEIDKTDEILNEKLRYLPKAFCFPFGTFDKKSVKNLRKIGRYEYLLGSFYGSIKGDFSRKVLPRIGISNDDTFETFVKKLKGKKNYKGILQRLRLSIHNLKKDRVTEYIYD